MVQCGAVCCIRIDMMELVPTSFSFSPPHSRLTYCNTLQHDATHCNGRSSQHLSLFLAQSNLTICGTLQHTATAILCNILHTLQQALEPASLPFYLSFNICTLQHAATHCNTLHTVQHTATHCNTLQHTATHCNTLQHTATHCNTLQHHATGDRASISLSIFLIQALHTATHCNTLQHNVTLQHTTLHCNTLHRTATGARADISLSLSLIQDSPLACTPGEPSCAPQVIISMSLECMYK